MTGHPYVEVDVFGTAGFDGNPLAVVHDADDLAPDEMQRIANWTNFSETSFLLQPTDPAADYKARIFTPDREIPFAGHPTVGSAHAWLEAGGQPQTDRGPTQECGIGLVSLKAGSEGRIGFAAPPLRVADRVADDERLRAFTVLGVDPERVLGVTWLDNGIAWLGVELADPDDLASLAPVRIDDRPVDICVFVARSLIGGADIELRCFFGETEIREDPVTGSANASVARHLLDHGKIAIPYVAAQGDYMGRTGRVYVTSEEDTLWISGSARTMISGTIGG